jgi:hypothetical protein
VKGRTRLLLPLVGLLALAGTGPVLARCADYRDPSVVSKEAFLDSPFGSLAVRYTWNRWLLLAGSGCFDLSRYRIATATFDINSRREPQPVYFAAGVTRTFDAARGQESQYSLELFRNASRAERADKWLRAIDDEAGMEAGIALNGSEFSVLRAGFDSGRLPDGSAAPGTDLAALPASPRWHALLGVVDGPRSPQVNIEILANSRFGINGVTAHLADLPDEPLGPVLTKVYLNKFLTAPEPGLGEPILEPGGGASCMYITHGVGGLPDISLSDTLNTVALKLGATDC